MKKLLIDVNSIVRYFASGKQSGIGRTTLELVAALNGIREIPFKIELYSQNMRGIGGRHMNTAFKCRHWFFPHRERWNWLLSQIPLKEWSIGYDLMHVPHNFTHAYSPERCIATIHDAMFFSCPESFLGHDYARRHYPSFAKRCKSIITCSHSSKKEIAEYMEVDPGKIRVIPWGVDHEILYPRSRKRNAYCGESPFFMSVSCDMGRKNTRSVINAFEQFVRHDPAHHLVLVWSNPPGEIRAGCQHPVLKGRVHFASDISNEELAQLYSDATATFFPSKYEGFGLPVLESFAAGTPVVTCRNSSLSEVGGEVALYVEPEDIEGMADIMAKFENGGYDYAGLQEKVLKQAAPFTWESTARKTLKIYTECLELA